MIFYLNMWGFFFKVLSYLLSWPGCDDKRLQKAHVCRRNGRLYLFLVLKWQVTERCSIVCALYTASSEFLGSLWDPNVAADVFLDEEHRTVTVVVGFKAARYSESYRVSIQSHNLFDWRNVSKVRDFLVRPRNHTNAFLQFESMRFSQCLEQTGKQNVPECDFWVWIVAALTVWDALKGEFTPHSWKWNKRSHFVRHIVTSLCFFSRFSHFLCDARMTAGAQLKPSITVNVSLFFLTF